MAAESEKVLEVRDVKLSFHPKSIPIAGWQKTADFDGTQQKLFEISVEIMGGIIIIEGAQRPSNEAAQRLRLTAGGLGVAVSPPLGA